MRNIFKIYKRMIHPLFSKNVIRNGIILLGIVFILLIFLNHSYLLFHVFVELFSVVIAFSLFTITWNTRKQLDNKYLYFIGIVALFIGILDIFHLITYEGMNVIYKQHSFYANQFWVAARFLESLSIMSGFIYLKRRINLHPDLFLLILIFITTTIILSILQWEIFPVCYIENEGQTSFKIISEYVIILILIISIGLLIKHKKSFESNVFHLLLASFIFAIITEFCFTLYVSNFGFVNQLGHFAKLITFYLMYKANVEAGFIKPTDTIFINLKKSERVIKATYDSTNENFFLLDKNYNIISFNKESEKSVEKIWNKKLQVGDNILQYSNQLLSDDFKNHFSQALEGKKIEFERQIKFSNDLDFWYNVKFMPVQDEHHEIEAVSFTALDITDRKKSELSLKESETKYKQLFNFLPVGISISDKNGKLIENNKGAEWILGITQEEHNKRSIDSKQWTIIRKDGTIMPVDEFASVRALKEKRLIENVEMGIVKKNKISWINVSAIPSITDERVIIAYVDITEKIEREIQLTELVATKDKFFSILAHDLKNPFNSLLGFSELLIKNAATYSPEKIELFAKTMNKSSKQAYALLENLLEWSRIQTGKFTITPIKIKPSEILDEIILLSQSSADAKKIALVLNIQSNDYFFSDMDMTKTVLRNLVSNAIKFTHTNGTITIHTEKKENEIEFCVSDTGIGIEPEHIGLLFRIDSKLSKPGTADEKGTGLGLILCKEFVEKNGGKIWAESQLGVGSKFKFTLPLHLS